MSEPTHAPEPTPLKVVRLVSPHLPSDQGLSSLGLLLQLGGSLGAAFVCFNGFVWLWATTFRDGTATLGILLLGVLSVVRSLMHRAAGTELLYGAAPLRGIRRYVAVALAHSALTSVLLASPLSYGLSVRHAVAIGLACAIWPAILWAVTRLPRFARYEDGLAPSEDKGFEGASVLMTVFGVAGLAIGSLSLWSVLRLPGALRGLGALLVLTIGLLVARSVVHVVAGVAGLRHSPLDVAVERAGRYANLGLVSALVTAGVLFLTVVGTRADFSAILAIALIGWVLSAWPLILRRYFGERHFASLLAGDDDPMHQRAPDGGVTSAGWLLLALGALQLGLALLGLIGGSGTDLVVVSELFGTSTGGDLVTALIAVAHLGVGLTLVLGGPRFRIIAQGVGAAALLLQLSTLWPLGRRLTTGVFDATQVAGAALSALPLVAVVTMLALVGRSVAPMAAATVHSKAR